MLLIIAVLAIGGVSALSYMANRYAQVLTQESAGGAPGSTARTTTAPVRQPMWQREATARALARVDRFIGVRSRIRAEIDRRGGRLPGAEIFDDLRESALNESGMDLVDYGSVREMFRSWRQGRIDQRNLMAVAFEQRKAELARLDLGEYESLDS
jgi:hypothetical protein